MFFFEDPNIYDVFFTLCHGCWCSKLNGINPENHRQKAVDDLDQVCKDWIRARRCSLLVDGACAGRKLPKVHYDTRSSFLSDYEIDVDYCQINTDFCQQQACEIDALFNSRVKHVISRHDFIFKNNKTCFPTEFYTNEAVPGFHPSCKSLFNITTNFALFLIFQEENECGCEFGQAASFGEDCPEHGMNYCVSCEIGYVLYRGGSLNLMPDLIVKRNHFRT